MTIYRVLHDKNNPYLTINTTIATDTRISWKAKGIWFYAFSRKDNWEFYEKDLIKRSTDSITSFRSGIKELEKFGYLYRSPQKKGTSGKFQSKEWYFFETPKTKQQIKEMSTVVQNPSTVNPSADSPSADNELLLSNEESSNEESINETPPTPSKGESETRKNSKLKFGEDKIVLLFQDEYDKLAAKMGKTRLDALIEELNDWMASNGRKYKSHFHVIKQWFTRKEKEKKTGSHREGSKLKFEAEDTLDPWVPGESTAEDFK